jgi:hypothetical protein
MAPVLRAKLAVMRPWTPKLQTSWVLAALALLASGPALARELYDDAYFVKAKGTAAGFYEDRRGCRREALGLGIGSASYSNPQYGALNAMGSALDEGELHEGGLRKRLQRAVFDDCMKRQGWSPLQPTGEEVKSIAKASEKRPQPLDAWLKAHEPADGPR